MTPTPHERALALAQDFNWSVEDHGAAILAIERSIGEAVEEEREASALFIENMPPCNGLFQKLFAELAKGIRKRGEP